MVYVEDRVNDLWRREEKIFRFGLKQDMQIYKDWGNVFESPALLS